jgi:hypothetical protein
MRERSTLWLILIVSAMYGVDYYANTGHIDLMSLVFVVIPLLGLTAKEEK